MGETRSVRWVVVGAGSAGSVVAARLAEVGEDVVLVEAGSGTVDPATTGASFFDAAAVPGRSFIGPFLRGRGVGGSSAINGMVATAGDAGQYRSWGWDDTDEALARVQVPLEPAAEDELGPIDLALLAAAADATRPPLTRRDGRRVSAWEAYADLPVRGGIELRADARRRPCASTASGRSASTWTTARRSRPTPSCCAPARSAHR